MADTETSIATLLATNFVNGQAAGAITPQDLRDLIISLETTFGGCYISSTAATSVAAVDTPLKLAGTTTANATLNGFSMPASNRLRNDGTATRMCLVTASISFSPASDAKVWEFSLAKNGTNDANSTIAVTIATAANDGFVQLSYLMELATTDYVEVWVENKTDDTNITADLMTLSIVGHIE